MSRLFSLNGLYPVRQTGKRAIAGVAALTACMLVAGPAKAVSFPETYAYVYLDPATAAQAHGITNGLLANEVPIMIAYIQDDGNWVDPDSPFQELFLRQLYDTQDQLMHLNQLLALAANGGLVPLGEAYGEAVALSNGGVTVDWVAFTAADILLGIGIEISSFSEGVSAVASMIGEDLAEAAARTENCLNGVDDDGDGLIDYADLEDCAVAEPY